MGMDENENESSRDRMNYGIDGNSTNMFIHDLGRE
jgi:hypothetical protein